METRSPLLPLLCLAAVLALILSPLSPPLVQAQASKAKSGQVWVPHLYGDEQAISELVCVNVGRKLELELELKVWTTDQTLLTEHSHPGVLEYQGVEDWVDHARDLTATFRLRAGHQMRVALVPVAYGPVRAWAWLGWRGQGSLVCQVTYLGPDGAHSVLLPTP